MSVDSHQPSRGHRVREFVCSYRTLRDDQGQAVRLSTLALSDPRVAADTLAPLLAQEAVEIFAVACLSTRHQLLAWHVLSRGTRSGTSVSLPDVFVPACLTPGTTPCSWRTTTPVGILRRVRTMPDSPNGSRTRPT